MTNPMNGSNAGLGAELMWRQQRLESTGYYLAALVGSGVWAAAAGASLVAGRCGSGAQHG